jgi:hypothetical protein
MYGTLLDYCAPKNKNRTALKINSSMIQLSLRIESDLEIFENRAGGKP